VSAEEVDEKDDENELAAEEEDDDAADEDAPESADEENALTVGAPLVVEIGDEKAASEDDEKTELEPVAEAPVAEEPVAADPLEEAREEFPKAEEAPAPVGEEPFASAVAEDEDEARFAAESAAEPELEAEPADVAVEDVAAPPAFICTMICALFICVSNDTESRKAACELLASAEPLEPSAELPPKPVLLPVAEALEDGVWTAPGEPPPLAVTVVPPPAFAPPLAPEVPPVAELPALSLGVPATSFVLESATAEPPALSEGSAALLPREADREGIPADIDENELPPALMIDLYCK
jgi:hypothetical protein